ncbi:MAG: branched-chain amino acid transport system II carrier protein [Peptostreptococcus sp.]|mgnify:FL=1|uniref:branched-chain amino acid transport system II carrier protein n=3 Tax=Peptostreptococcus sp. TaxID=1262 RepID=UPI001CAD42E1|nr:branched-chain amino acid transport system II carrier protein [Peptostreptococcus sp.]MBF1049146.1 branched-chain amino acid transport system II carrier protein [Peptostreptococcus sp.]MBF1052685.1 branched-chain amino acid transport system II carrier protein [Peptostreptococcus sp.]MBF1057247.1 branched-chain amino acid transport system II carrier protein [Peptostreptococcus sp.]
MSIKFKDIVVIGFALFAMFFGAGNLIFPPFLGVISGTKWFVSFMAFLFADGGLALLGVIAATGTQGDMMAFFGRAGKKLGIVIASLTILCIGPFVAIPRTAATTYEIGIVPNFGHSLSPIVFAIIFFVIVLVLTIKPSKVVDIIGAFLTPVLLICLAVLIIKGIVSPLGAPLDRTLVDNVFISGINDGYQTLDGMAGAVFAGIVIASVKQKGYTEKKVLVKATILAGIVAVVGLALVYGGLTYLGATVSPQYDNTVERTTLVISITQAILGGPGKVILGLVVGLACLTTAIGLTSACGNYFSDLTEGKLKYEVIVVVVCVFSAIISNFGVDKIIQIAAPLLYMMYPAVVTLILLGLIHTKIQNKNVYVLASWVALILGVAHELSTVPLFAKVGVLASLTEALNKLPGHSVGFYWIIPVLVAAIVGKFIAAKKEA